MRISDWSSDVCSSDLLVGRVAQKLVNQVAVGAVYFHTIKAGGNGVACALSKRSHDAGNLFDGQGARHRVRHLALGRVDLTLNRSEEHTSELQSLMRISYAVFCLKKKKSQNKANHIEQK